MIYNYIQCHDCLPLMMHDCTFPNGPLPLSQSVSLSLSLPLSPSTPSHSLSQSMTSLVAPTPMIVWTRQRRPSRGSSQLLPTGGSRLASFLGLRSRGWSRGGAPHRMTNRTCETHFATGWTPSVKPSLCSDWWRQWSTALEATTLHWLKL